MAQTKSLKLITKSSKNVQIPYFVQILGCTLVFNAFLGQASCSRLEADKLANKFIFLSRHLKNDFGMVLQSTEAKLKATSQAKVMIPSDT